MTTGVAQSPKQRRGLDLRGAYLQNVDLSGLPLDGLVAGAILPDAIPSGQARTPIGSLIRRVVVTIVISELHIPTIVMDGIDPEDLRAPHGSLSTAIARQIHAHGGTVERNVGDSVLAFFGLGTAHDDDPLRAVRAALDMQAAVRQFNQERQAVDPSFPALAMRIGIHMGEVAAASEGGEFLVIGAPLNVAASLRDRAPLGSIVVGQRTRASTINTGRYRALPAMRMSARPDMSLWEVVELSTRGQEKAPRELQNEPAHVDLEGANLSRAHLKGADLSRARLDRAERAPRGAHERSKPVSGATRACDLE
jgi:class 3 adenylate cyclase